MVNGRTVKNLFFALKTNIKKNFLIAVLSTLLWLGKIQKNLWNISFAHVQHDDALVRMDTTYMTSHVQPIFRHVNAVRTFILRRLTAHGFMSTKTRLMNKPAATIATVKRFRILTFRTYADLHGRMITFCMKTHI